MLIRLVFTEIQPFENVKKFTKKCMAIGTLSDTASGCHTFARDPPLPCELALTFNLQGKSNGLIIKCNCSLYISTFSSSSERLGDVELKNNLDANIFVSEKESNKKQLYIAY